MSGKGELEMFEITDKKVKMVDNGEGSKDIYCDVLLKKGNEYVKMVARNVFDFGYYVYPKRVEGSERVFNKTTWTDLEKEAEEWLNEFSPISRELRM